jgi:hypothetical protein
MRSKPQIHTAYRFADISAVVIIAIFSAMLVYQVRHAIPDDAFIYLRIAENIISGNGWTYNAGIPSNAATSPVYLAVLAAIGMIGITGPNTLLVAYALGLFALSSTIYWQLRNQGRIQSIILALAASGLPLILENVGLETSIFLACVVLTSMVYARGWQTSTGVLAGITALARPEGIAMLVLILGADVSRRKPIAWQTILPFLCVIVPWLAFSLFEFGSIVPHTATVKSLQSNMALWDANWPISFIKQIPLYAFVLPLALVGLLLTRNEFLKDRPFLFLIIGFGIVQIGGYSVLKAPVGYFWYYAPGNLAVYLSAVFAFVEVSRKLWIWQNTSPKRVIANPGANRSFSGFRNHLGLQVKIANICLAAFFGYFLIQEIRLLTHLFNNLQRPYRLSEEYVAIGQWLKEHADSTEWVAADEIGYVGYYSNLPIRDMLGLLEKTSIIPLSQHRWDWWYTDYPNPKYIVLHKAGWPGEPNSRLSPWPAKSYASFTNNYKLVHVAGPIGVFQNSSMQIDAAKHSD